MAVEGQEIWKVPDEVTYRGECLLGVVETDVMIDGLMRAMLLRRGGVDMVAVERVANRTMTEFGLDEEDMREVLLRVWQRVEKEMSSGQA